MIDLNRRRFLKYAGASAAVVGASAVGLHYLLKPPTATQTYSTSSTSTKTTSDAPLVVKDLNKEISQYNADLSSFVSGNIDRGMIKNAETLRSALRTYAPSNRESEGQAKRLDQLALSGLHLYSWASRLQQDDVKAITDKRFNPPDIMPASSRISELLGLEIYPPPDYLRNVGSFQTDVATEHFIAPSLRPEFAALYDSLNANNRAALKGAFETYNPDADSIQDYKQVSEEHIWLTDTNGWLKWLFDTPGDVYRKDVHTVFENGFARSSSLGKIANRAYDLLPRRSYAQRDGYSQYVDSAFSELPSNHKGMNDYDFAFAVMNTPTFINLRNKAISPDKTTVDPSVEFMLPKMLGAVFSLASRESLTLTAFPYHGSYFSSSAVGFNGRYYSTDFWESPDQIVGTPPSLNDISNSDFGYGGYRKDLFWVVTRSILDYWNTIPTLVYVPGRGVVIA